MQTFLPYPDFKESAKILDNKRLGKQRIEARQILEINIIRKNPENFIIDGAGFILEKGMQSGQSMYYMPLVEYLEKNPNFKIPWENHPAVLMWRGYEKALAFYGWIICMEWRNRGFRDNQIEFFTDNLPVIISNIDTGTLSIKENLLPDWLGNEQLHLSHRANLLRKDYDYYVKYFGEIPNYQWMPYFWAVKKEI